MGGATQKAERPRHGWADMPVQTGDYSLDLAHFGERVLRDDIEGVRCHEPDITVRETDCGRAASHGNNGYFVRTSDEGTKQDQNCMPRAIE